jgi:hypothetical protein
MLPMLPPVYAALVYAALKAMWGRAGGLEDGWSFPASTRDGDINKDGAKSEKARDHAGECQSQAGERQGVEIIPALCAQAALTQLAESGCDVSCWPGSPDIPQ